MLNQCQPVEKYKCSLLRTLCSSIRFNDSDYDLIGGLLVTAIEKNNGFEKPHRNGCYRLQ